MSSDPAPDPDAIERRSTAQIVLGGLDDLLVEQGSEGLFEEDMPAACPRERRAADIRFAALAVVIVSVGIAFGIAPGARKRTARIDRYGDIVHEAAGLRQELADLKRMEQRLDALDPYLIERLARDRMLLMKPGEKRIRDLPPADQGGR